MSGRKPIEKRLSGSAKLGWEEAMHDFHHPPIPDPRFVFDRAKREGFHISPDEGWRVTLNLLEAPMFLGEDELVDFFRSISHHEIGHYDMCPYDGLMTAELLSAAMKHVSKYLAPIVVNVFADLLVDTYLVEKYEDLTLRRERTIIKQVLGEVEQLGGLDKLSRFWKILIHSYEVLWKEDLGLGTLDTSDVEAVANLVAKIVRRQFWVQKTWPGKVKRIAQLLSSTIEEEFTVQVGLVPAGSGSRMSESGDVVVEVPNEVLGTMGNPLEVKHKDKLDADGGGRERDRKREMAEEFARGKNFVNFGSPAVLAGLVQPDEALATWYRGRARGLIDIRIYVEKPGGLIPAYPLPWRVGDSIEELDVVQSLLVSPVLIPNITTRKWHREEGPGLLEEVKPPDLMIVLDSSGSMNWNPYASRSFGQYDTALVAAFAALHFASRRGCKVASLNFSDVGISCNWTKDYRLVEKNLLSYQGGGTEIPVKGMLGLVGKAERSSLVLLITDFGIYNFRAAKRAFNNILDSGHKIVAFFIDGTQKELEGEDFKSLGERGAQFYPVRNVKDLVGLVIEEVKKYYGD
ncbi:MAG: hypothetical protein ACTSU5_16860 [Promethearchaeota archaeon]